MELVCLYEDEDIFVTVKPPKIPSQPDKTGDEDMILLIDQYLKNKKEKVVPVIHVLHRLDRPVGGIMVYAKNKDAAAYLTTEIKQGHMDKVYEAVVCGKLEQKKGEYRNYLLKKEYNNTSAVIDKNRNNAKLAVLNFETLGHTWDENETDLTLVRIQLLTGRHHQIRVQFSHAGFPIWGDNKYNSSFEQRKGWTQIALFATGLSFTHPRTKKKMSFYQKSDEFPFSLFYDESKI